MNARWITLACTTSLVSSVLVAPAVSAASVRYASPTGSGTACTQSAPCTINEAVSGASAGDTVQLSADEYYPTGQLSVNVDNLTIAGPPAVSNPGDFVAYIIFREQADGGPVPDNDPKILVYGDNFRMQRVAVSGRADGLSMIGAGAGKGATYDRVLLRNSGDFFSLVAVNGTITNSLVVQTGSSPFGGAALVTGAVTGSTFYSANGTALGVNDNFTAAPFCSATIRNTMAWGGAKNLEVDGGGVGCPTLAVDYDYSWIPDASGGSLGGGIHVNSNPPPIAGTHNLANTPAVFDPTDPGNSYLSDLVLPPRSPAIDAGCTAGCGEHDYYGRPRPIGTATDIGPREQSLAPALSGPTVSSSADSLDVSALINPRGDATTYVVQVRPMGQTPWDVAGSGRLDTGLFTATPVTHVLSGLRPATTYEVRASATNARGDASTPITQVTTQPEPATVSVSRLRTRAGKRSVTLRSRVTVSTAGQITQRVLNKGRTRCTVVITTATAGTVPLQCVMGSGVRKALRAKALRLKVITSLAPSAGDTVTTRMPVRVARKR